VYLALPILAVAMAPPGLSAQTPVDSIRTEIARLAALVDSLSREVQRLQAEGQPEQAGDAMAQLRAAAQAAASAGGGAHVAAGKEDQEFVGRGRSLQALNPEISVNSDVLGYVNKDDAHKDNFFAREFEISLISNLDPYSRAKVFISRHSPGGEFAPFASEGHEEEGEGFSVEEGYIEWVGLPGGIGVKLGRFAQQFGQLNRWHAHALPFQTRSLPHLTFIGEEFLAQTGASVHWLAPIGGASGTYEATVEVTRSENEKLFGESGRLSVLTHVNGFWNLSSSVDFDLGVSWLNGSYENANRFVDRNLYGMEAAVNWRPPGRAAYRSLTVRGGVMALEGLLPPEDASDAQAAEAAKRALGVWALGELRLSQTWLVGARLDRTENPANPSETAWLFSPTLTRWQSEFVRLRVEYDMLGRSFEAGREGHLLLQVTFAMGPHKHETY